MWLSMKLIVLQICIDLMGEAYHMNTEKWIRSILVYGLFQVGIQEISHLNFGSSLNVWRGILLLRVCETWFEGWPSCWCHKADDALIEKNIQDTKAVMGWFKMPKPFYLFSSFVKLHQESWNMLLFSNENDS